MRTRSTIEQGDDVLFRRGDLEEIAERLRRDGYKVDLDFTLGEGDADRFIDAPPYTHKVHLKIKYGEYIATSYALLIEK